MAVTRFQIAANKKSALAKQQIREIALLLASQPPKEEKARIKAEALIRDDNTVEAYEILQLTCELLAERINLVSHSRDCPPDLISSVSTLIWASAIVDVPELIEIRRQFRFKYGKEFDEDAMQNVGGVINERVAAKLSVQPPSAYLVQTYLEKIADEHEVQWKPKIPLTARNMADPMAPPVGDSVPVGGGSGLVPGTWRHAKEHDQSRSREPDTGHASAPPISPAMGNLPVAPRGDDASLSRQSGYVSVLPPPPTPPSNIEDVDEEVDIFVPGAPKIPPGAGNIRTDDDRRGKDDDDDEENSGNAGGGGRQSSRGNTQVAGEESAATDAGIEESYDDLAARFAMLQK